jgi:hypothetical protein
MGVQEFPNLSSGRNESIAPFISGNEAQMRNRVTTKRSLIQWQLPHLGDNQFIEMYVNPQNLQFSSRKEINRVRTKGGFITQYWGEDVDTVNVQGITGSGGVEVINVLRDIYRSEQLALLEIVTNKDATDKRRQSLMQLAASVVMWYQGQGFRGYFTDMNYTENANNTGLFEYTLSFIVVEVIGKRKNFLPWHRHPWSTTQTPNVGPNQTVAGGGYLQGNKVGVLNLPPLDLGTSFTIAGIRPHVVQVAVLRADSKDGSTEASFNFRGSASDVVAQNANRAISDAIRQQQKAGQKSPATLI